MAGPLSSEEIEDVVSSVRRLVSNEQRPRNLSRDLGADRLMLTPALRVVAESGPIAPLMLSEPIVEALIEPFSEAPVLPEVELSPPNLTVVTTVVTGEAIEADWEDEIWTGSDDPSLAEIALGADEAEVLTPPPEVATEVAMVSHPDKVTEPWAQFESEAVDDDPVPFVPLRRRAEDLVARLAAEAVGDAARSGADPDVARALETALFVERETEPQAVDAETNPKVAAEEVSTQRMPTEVLDADGVPLAVLDEAALQEIVRLMIREELQGALGERITRSVRKLVRAEINRALVARDLD
jgi:hypothetical protein